MSVELIMCNFKDLSHFTTLFQNLLLPFKFDVSQNVANVFRVALTTSHSLEALFVDSYSYQSKLKVYTKT